MKRKVLAVAAAAACALGMSLPAQAQISGDTIKIGIITDMSGVYADIDGAGGVDSLQTPDDVWDRVVDVNVMAHVRAARVLVPRWLADGGGGRFVVTASAAGLLTMIGSAPYSVTKHAAVGFAEWLSVTYGARGVDVHAICPQGVKTQMLEDAGLIARTFFT